MVLIMRAYAELSLNSSATSRDGNESLQGADSEALGVRDDMCRRASRMDELDYSFMHKVIERVTNDRLGSTHVMRAKGLIGRVRVTGPADHPPIGRCGPVTGREFLIDRHRGSLNPMAYTHTGLVLCTPPRLGRESKHTLGWCRGCHPVLVEGIWLAPRGQSTVGDSSHGIAESGDGLCGRRAVGDGAAATAIRLALLEAMEQGMTSGRGPRHREGSHDIVQPQSRADVTPLI